MASARNGYQLEGHFFPGIGDHDGLLPGRDSHLFDFCHLQLNIKLVLRLRYSQPEV